jgi:hypothetical protein
MHCLEVIKKINNAVGLRVSVQASQRGYVVLTFKGDHVIDSRSFVQGKWSLAGVDQLYAEASAYAEALEKQLGIIKPSKEHTKQLRRLARAAGLPQPNYK